MVANDELGRCGRKPLCYNFKHYTGICLEDLRETTKAGLPADIPAAPRDNSELNRRAIVAVGHCELGLIPRVPGCVPSDRWR